MCRSLKFLVEKLVKEGHLIRYVKEAYHKEESEPAIDKIAAGVATQSKPKPVINYILGSPFDNKYQSKRQQKKILRVAIIKAKVKDIHTKGSCEEIRPIDGPTSFISCQPEQDYRAPL